MQEGAQKAANNSAGDSIKQLSNSGDVPQGLDRTAEGGLLAFRKQVVVNHLCHQVKELQKDFSSLCNIRDH